MTGDIINIVDFSNWTINTYRINVRVNERDPNTLVYSAFPVSTSSRVEILVNETKQVIQMHRTQAKQGVIDLGQIPTPCGQQQTLKSGWDLVKCHGAQNNFLNHIYNNDVASLSQYIAGYLNVIKHELNFSILNQKTDLIFTLSDGARVVLTFAYTGSTSQAITGGVYRIDFDKSTDKDGNPLRLSAANTSEGGINIDVNPQSDNLTSFLEAASRSGLVIDISSNGIGIGTMRCTTSANSMTCVLTSRN